MTAKTFAGRRHRAICPPVPGQRAVREQAQLLLASVRGDRISVRHTGAKLAMNLWQSFHNHGECVKVPTEGPSGGLLRDCEIFANLRCEL